MINGYVGAFGPADGLRQGSSIIWWGDDADRERGLSFASQRAIFDQHFYQRGRFGRLLSTLATSDAHFGGVSKVGVGVDYATGIHNTADTVLSETFGASSAAVLDLESLSSPIAWVGPNKVLSTRNVVTHLLPPDDGGPTAYDLATRTVTRAGVAVATPTPAAAAGPTVPGATGKVYLGGDVVGGGSTTVVSQVVADAKAAVAGGAQSRIVVLAASSKDKKAINAYSSALKAAGWSGKVEVVEQGKNSKVAVTGAAAAVLVGETPASVATALADPTFAGAVRSAVLTSPVVLADRHLTAALGTWFSTKADPTATNYEEESVENFRTGDGAWQRGLGLVTGSLVPSLTLDYRWGKLYDLGALEPGQIAWGLGENTAVRVAPGAAATVVGDGSVVALDPRGAQFWTGPNGAIGAVNVLLNTFGAGETLRLG